MYIVTVVRLTAFIQIALAPSLRDIGRAAWLQDYARDALHACCPCCSLKLRCAFMRARRACSFSRTSGSRLAVAPSFF